AIAVQQRVGTTFGLDTLVQVRTIGAGATPLAELIDSIHAVRRAPDSPLRLREDVSERELVLLAVSAAGPGRLAAIDLANEVRHLYEMRGLAELFTIELLCLLPDLFSTSVTGDYGAAYSLLKMIEAAMGDARGDRKPFDEVWLLASTNGKRVQFGRIEEARETYAEAIAGLLTLEPESSGALAGARRPRQMQAAFSSFGYAELRLPLEAALQRLEPRLAAQLLREKLLATPAATSAALPQLAAKQFVVSDAFAVPMSRIGIEAGQSLFHRFQPRTVVNEKTRNADEVIAAVRNELRVHREGVYLESLRILATQDNTTATDFAALLSSSVDETLDRDGYAEAIRFLEALLDPLPDLRPEASVGPRNLVTEINSATAAFDARLRFTPNTTASDATRKRIRDLDTLLADQTLVADVLAPLDTSAASADPDADEEAEAARERAESLAAMTREESDLTRQLPALLFAEESANNAARNTARDDEASRLKGQTEGAEQHLRELFAERPRAQQTLRERLEERRAYIWRQIWRVVFGVALGYGLPFALGGLLKVPVARELYLLGVENLAAVNKAVSIGIALFAIYATLRYLGSIAPRLRAAREDLRRIEEQIDVTDKAKNNAHNDELQFEYDVTLRRTTLNVLRRTREAARRMFDILRTRLREFDALAEALAARARAASIDSAGLSVALLDDGEVDGWYERTAAERTLLFREFFEHCISRSASRQLPAEELRQRIQTYAAHAFDGFRKVTIADVVSGRFGVAADATVTQRLKRLADYSAPLIEVRSDDVEAEKATQRDTTLWIDAADSAFVGQVRRRMPEAEAKTARDPLRMQALSRVLHYPAYVLGQLEYYRAQYDPALYPESAGLPDLLPTELAVTGAVRTAYEQLLLGRAVGVIQLRDDGQLHRASSDAALGETHLVAARHLASFAGAIVRRELDGELAPHLAISQDVERDLRQLQNTLQPLSGLDRDLLNLLIKRYASTF
ncbi:MAG: hypothetical protein JWO56_498, partial [Acidobacteria bacterium]|nr:hypothetical protein [Acidobacteriota bacterium]